MARLVLIRNTLMVLTGIVAVVGGITYWLYTH
jgi:hypothetical protein